MVSKDEEFYPEIERLGMLEKRIYIEIGYQHNEPVAVVWFFIILVFIRDTMLSFL